GELTDAHLEHMQTLIDHRFFLLSDQQAARLSAGAEGVLDEAFLNEAIETAYDLSHAGVISQAEDPLGLFNQYLLTRVARTPGADAVTIGPDGLARIRVDQQTFVILHGRAEGAYSLEAQEAMALLEEDMQSRPEYRDLQLLRAGAIFHASRAAATAKTEVAFIATGSALGIIVLFLVTFRSLAPLLLSLSSILFGCLSALILCGNLFGHLHLVTLVFGASLIGVAVDYSLHYLIRVHDDSPRLPGLGLALLTSTLGYGSLLQTSLPGLQEMALFSITGLLASGLFVMVIFPRWVVRTGVASAGINTAPRPLLTLCAFPALLWRGRRKWFATLLLVAAAPLIWRAELVSELSVFHEPDRQLLEQQKQIERLLPRHAPNQYFLISGGSAEDMLQHAEAFKPSLQHLVQQGVIDDYTLLSDMLPSQLTQRQHFQTLRDTVYRPGGEADAFYARLGFNSEIQQRFHESLETAQPLLPEAWLATAPAEEAILWMGRQQEHNVSLVLLTGIAATAPLQRAAINQPDIEFVDTVASLSASIASRSQAAARLLVLAYCIIAVLLLLRYRQLSALMLLLLPAGASLFTIAVLSTLGIPLTLFHIFALYLILGLGMDYGIFQRESGPQSRSCQLAILLSVLTSSLSFGLLAASSTPMIAAFGVTVMLGGIGNWLLSPFAAKTSKAHYSNI
ncbi:MAG: MMPL family transporter, partial [Pseudomonadota bacterium]